MALYVHRDHKDYEGLRAYNGHLDFHTALFSARSSSVLLYVHRDHKDH